LLHARAVRAKERAVRVRTLPDGPSLEWHALEPLTTELSTDAHVAFRPNSYASHISRTVTNVLGSKRRPRTLPAMAMMFE
jgi:hypothetical protein